MTETEGSSRPDDRALDLNRVSCLPVYHRATIPEEYLDDMGHMNVRWYVALFGGGARELFASMGMTEEYFRRENNGTFALKQHIHYLAEVRVGQTVSVRCRLLGRSEKRLHFMHFMVNETVEKIAATMEVLAAHVDLGMRRTTPFPESIAARVDALLADHERLPWTAPVCGVIQA